MKAETRRVALISMHSSPVGEIGTRDTGGMSVYIREVARKHAGMGYAVDIFTRVQHPGGRETLWPFDNVRIIHLQAGPSQPLAQLSLYHHLPEFYENLEHFRIDEGIHYSLVHSHYWLSGQIGRWCRRRWQVPHVFMFHTLGALKNTTMGPDMEPDLRLSVEKQLAAECDRIIAGTVREKRHIVDLYGASPKKIQVIPCGVDLARFRPSNRWKARVDLGLRANEQVVLYVGRFDPVKGVERLLAAAAMLRSNVPVRVMLVGGGEVDTPEVGALRGLCSQLRLEDRVTFAGRKGHDSLADYYRAADVLVLPSYYESFGLVMLEALACGTPVVATRVGAAEDLIRNGINGWVLPDNTPESLAAGMRRALQLKAIQGVSAGSIRVTVRNYDWSFVATAIDSEYRALLANGDVPESGRLSACCSAGKSGSPAMGAQTIC